jgi:hypothetical protein
MDELDAVARTEIQPGWDVYDADGDLVGRVREVSDMSFAVETTGLVEAIVGIGFDQVESADDGRVALAVSGDEIAATIDEAGAG